MPLQHAMGFFMPRPGGRFIPTGGTVFDIDGNEYHWITIGTQQWLVENLKTTKYADGTPIPHLIPNGDGWFLPSLLLLQEAYNNLKLSAVGGFSDAIYSSSSSFYEDSNDAIKSIDFTDGSLVYSSKASSLKVRAFQSFTDVVGAYSLRDTGPGGGLICYIDGTTYYEAGASDLADSTWSNLTTDYIVTEEAIADSQANTTAIIGQAGHTASAAKLCDDLSAGGWINDTTGAYCYYNNDISNKVDYGALYNWYAVDNAHGLAPTGWRVPDENDWNTLETFIGGDAVAGGKLKEIGLAHWTTPNTGATDDYGFKAMGNGYRADYNGSFNQVRQYGGMWFSDSIAGSGYLVGFNYNLTSSVVSTDLKSQGFSVRCMRDIP